MADYSELALALLRRRGMPPLGDRVVGTSTDGRPAYLNPDGSLSTERTRTEKHPLLNGGEWTNIPTIFDGRQMGVDEAVDYINANQPEPKSLMDMLSVFDPVTGLPLESYKSLDDAIAAAEMKSRAMEINPVAPWKAFWKGGK